MCIRDRVTRLGLFCLSFQSLRALLEQINRSKAKPRASEQINVRHIAIAVEYSSRFSIGNVKCLAKALTANTLMSIYSISCQMHIGVAKAKDVGIEAHAWVEVDKKVIVGYLPDLSRFQPMSSPTQNVL